MQSGCGCSAGDETIWLLLALVLGQALYVLHAAQHPLAAPADYDCAVCGHGFDGQQALAGAAPAVPAVEAAAASAPRLPSLALLSPASQHPPIRGPPVNLV